MRILLKTILKNVFGKPFRSLLVIFSIFVCVLAALFNFDLVQSEKTQIRGLLTSIFADADLTISVPVITSDLQIPEGFPENEHIVLSTMSETLYKEIPGEYNVVTTDKMTVCSVDLAKAYQMGYVPIESLHPGETMVTKKYADAYGVSEGDRITVHDKIGETHEFTVVKINDGDNRRVMQRGNTVIVCEEDMNMLTLGKPVSGIILMDVTDDERIPEAEDIMKEVYGEDNVSTTTLDEESEQFFNELFGILFLLFAIAFLLVIFITFSIGERIVSERMAFVGTLRSLGVTSGGTALILLAENVIYAILGAIPGLLLYVAIRPGMMESVVVVSGDVTLDTPDLSVGLVIFVFLGAILIECLIPLKSILKALHVSIRDIIFDNRDTEYKYTKGSLIRGLVLTGIGVAALFGKSITFASISLVALVVALAFLYPHILKWVMGWVERLAEKRERAKIALAAREAMSRKSTVASGVLCATSAAMCIIIYIIATSLNSTLSTDVYSCDVVVTCSDASKYYSFVPFLEGVTGTENLYETLSTVYIGDVEKEKTTQIFGYPEGGFQYYHGLFEMPEKVEKGTILVEKDWAKKNGYDIGDPLHLIFDPKGVFPIAKDYIIAGYFKIDTYEGFKNNFVISESDYIDIFHDFPGRLLVGAEDPEKARDAIKTYAVGHVSEVQTRQEILDQNAKDNAQSGRILKIVILVAMGMTFIGMSSNQILGFEGRKKECAVMISTSMTKQTLSGILFREMLLSSFTAVSAGTLVGVLLVGVIKKAADYSEGILIPIEMKAQPVIALWILMTLVFAGSVLFPIRNMRKMKLSEQIKYE